MASAHPHRPSGPSTHSLSTSSSSFLSSLLFSPSPAPPSLRLLSLLLPLLLWLTYSFDSSPSPLPHSHGVLFGTHIGLMATAFLLVLPEGVLAASRAVWERGQGGGRAVRQHVLLQLTAMLLGLVGVVAMLLHRHSKRARHFTSAHAWCGVIAMLATELSGLIGALAVSSSSPSSSSSSSISSASASSSSGAMPSSSGAHVSSGGGSSGGAGSSWFSLRLSRQGSLALRALHRVMGRLSLLLAAVTILLAMKVFHPQHPRHKGWRTNVLACLVVAHAVGMQSALWPSLKPVFALRFLKDGPISLTFSLFSTARAGPGRAS